MNITAVIFPFDFWGDSFILPERRYGEATKKATRKSKTKKSTKKTTGCRTKQCKSK